MPPPPNRVTMVPWEDVLNEEKQEKEVSTSSNMPLAPKDGFNLLDKNAVIGKRLSLVSREVLNGLLFSW